MAEISERSRDLLNAATGAGTGQDFVKKLQPELLEDSLELWLKQRARD